MEDGTTHVSLRLYIYMITPHRKSDYYAIQACEMPRMKIILLRVSLPLNPTTLPLLSSI